MKKRLVVWGTNKEEKRQLVAAELKPEDNKVDVWVFSSEQSTDEFGTKLLTDWYEKKETELPAEGVHVEMPLTMSEEFLPEDLTYENESLVIRTKRAWHFMVLALKLQEKYHTELEEIKGKIDSLAGYDNQTWDELKGFWKRVQDHWNERILTQEDVEPIKEKTNQLFDQLKEMKSEFNDELKKTSRKHFDTFSVMLNEIDDRIQANKNLKQVFDDLKKVQEKFKGTEITRDYHRKIWNRLDSTFKKVKEKRFGDASQGQRIQKRLEGLLGAIDRMERSVKRDGKEIEFQKRKIDSVRAGQLETQIREAKIQIVQDKLDSKNEKLSAMHDTKKELEEKLAQIRKREEKALEQKAKKEAQAAAKSEKKADESKEVVEEQEPAPKANETKPEAEKQPAVVKKEESETEDEKAEVKAEEPTVVENKVIIEELPQEAAGKLDESKPDSGQEEE